MAKSKSKLITLDELEKALGYASRDSGTVPEGFKTSKEWAREWGCSMRTAQMRISDAQDAGILELRKFRRKSIDGGNYYAPHYSFDP